MSRGSGNIKKLLNSAKSLMSRNRWKDAIDLLGSNRAFLNEDWELSWSLGWCYFKLGNMDEALIHLERSGKIAPSDRLHACKFALGSVLLKKEQNSKANLLLKQSLRLKEFYPARLSLALSYMKLGKLKEAEQVHLQGLALKPNSSERYSGYACFLPDVGRDEEAERMERKADELRRIH